MRKLSHKSYKENFRPVKIIGKMKDNYKNIYILQKKIDSSKANGKLGGRQKPNDNLPLPLPLPLIKPYIQRSSIMFGEDYTIKEEASSEHTNNIK